MIYLSVVSGGFVEIWGINNTFTLRHYHQLLRDGMDALQTTLILAGVSAPLTAAVGILHCLSGGPAPIPGPRGAGIHVDALLCHSREP